MEVTVTDLLAKIGSLTVELDVARGEIQQLQQTIVELNSASNGKVEELVEQ